jgi:Tetratricopeptide repeat
VQKLIDSVQQRLQAFLRQRDDVALAVRSADDEAMVVSKILEGMDDASSAELYWACTDEFTDAASWVSAVVDAFAVKHAGVAMKLAGMELPAWPPMPDSLLDGTRPPVQRLRDLMVFSRSLAPLPEGLTVWCLFPLAVHDWRAWAMLSWELLQHEFPQPWFHHLRVFLRGDHDGWMRAVATEMPRLAWYEPDLSQSAMQAALDEEAMDATLPMDQRMQNVFLSAQMDYAFSRPADAMQKYALLLKYYAGTRNGTMAALVLNALGETHVRLGNLDQAANCFERAIVPAADSTAPAIPVLLNISLNLGNLRMTQGRWAEAGEHYDIAQGFAVLQRAPDTRLRAIENLGACQYAQGRFDEAVGTWRAGIGGASALEMAELQAAMLDRLRGLYTYTNDHRNRVGVEQEMRALGYAPPQD